MRSYQCKSNEKIAKISVASFFEFKKSMDKGKIQGYLIEAEQLIYILSLFKLPLRISASLQCFETILYGIYCHR
jgi:hypothetical protein